ncbi:transcriptional regulator [Streptomyces fumigatiscleroticus]|nr:transcriptional regulator [Streptomyces fumigatiscleroticus]
MTGHLTTGHPREERLAAAFVELADTLVDDFDVIGFLHTLADHCVALTESAAAGVLLTDPKGEVLDVAASDERTRALEAEGVEWNEGPCVASYRAGAQIPGVFLDDSHADWPRYTKRARQAGFTFVAAVPLRLREQVIGAVDLYRDGPGPLPPDRLRVGQSLADVAAIGLLQQRAVDRHATVAAQLHTALESRIVIEQAKGALAQRHGIGVDDAFHRLRQYARSHRRRITDVAREVVDKGVDVTGHTSAR